MKNDQTTTTPSLSNYDGDADAFVGMMERKINASQNHWNGLKYKLEATTKENEELYLGTHADKRDEEEVDTPASDNRIFSSVRTIVPYVTSRITEPEVYPSSRAASAKRFAEDFEKAIYIKAKKEKVRDKAKFALEDAIIRRRGYLKPRYDAATRNFCAIDYVPCESIIVDHKARPFEEPRYFRHLLDKSVEDLLTMFPDKEKQIYGVFFPGQPKESVLPEQLEQEHCINEDWAFVKGKDGELDLVVCWNYKKIPFGCIQDPNWDYDGDNFLDNHTMPLVFFNVLSDGRSLVDRTSFVEQAKYLQKNVDEREEQISKNAGLGSIGMPVVAADALADDQAENLTYDAENVLVLDTGESGRLQDKFDVWKAGTLPNFVYEDKIDSRNAIDNAFGTPNVFRGEQSKNNTLGQDVLVRDQAFGRQQEVVDAIDTAMERLYPLIAQFLLVYGEEEEMFEFNGEDSEFDYVMIKTAELDTKVTIQIRSGTSMPIDRAQRRQTADKAASYKMIDPLSYWEIMDERNAQKYARRVTQFNTDPANYMKDEDDKDTFSRDAFVDIQKIKNGEQPEFREDLPKEYFDYLNQYVLSGDLDNPTIPEPTRQAITQFIDAQLARGQKMLGMAETQLPTPEEVTAANEQTDQVNQQDQQAAAQQQAQQPESPGYKVGSPTPNPQPAPAIA
jgi:hypothetical protein